MTAGGRDELAEMLGWAIELKIAADGDDPIDEHYLARAVRDGMPLKPVEDRIRGWAADRVPKPRGKPRKAEGHERIRADVQALVDAGAGREAAYRTVAAREGLDPETVGRICAPKATRERRRKANRERAARKRKQKRGP